MDIKTKIEQAVGKAASTSPQRTPARDRGDLPSTNVPTRNPRTSVEYQDNFVALRSRASCHSVAGSSGSRSSGTAQTVLKLSQTDVARTLSTHSSVYSSRFPVRRTNSAQRVTADKRAKKVRLYRNGDRYFAGMVYPVPAERYRTLEPLLSDLNQSIVCNRVCLPTGVRYLFSVSTGRRVTSIEQLEDGASYVCSSGANYRPLDYDSIGHFQFAIGTDKQKSTDDTPHDRRYHSPTGRRDVTSSSPSRRSAAAAASPLSPDATVADAEESSFRPRLITVIRNGSRPRRAVRVLLNRKTAQSYEQVLTEISDVIKLDTGAVKKVFTVDGSQPKQVTTLKDFFSDEFIFLACGHEKHPANDFDLSDGELQTLRAGCSLSYRRQRSFTPRPQCAATNNRNHCNHHHQHQQDHQQQQQQKHQCHRAHSTTRNTVCTNNAYEAVANPQFTVSLTDTETLSPTDSLQSSPPVSPQSDVAAAQSNTLGRYRHSPAEILHQLSASTSTTPSLRPPDSSLQAGDVGASKSPAIDSPSCSPSDGGQTGPSSCSSGSKGAAASDYSPRGLSSSVTSESTSQSTRPTESPRFGSSPADAGSSSDGCKTGPSKTRGRRRRSAKHSRSVVVGKTDTLATFRGSAAGLTEQPKEPTVLRVKYRIGKLIGEGNFAIVKECTEKARRIKFALKIISKDKCRGKEEEIENEVNILRRLKHSNVVQLIEDFNTTDRLYMVMELVTGGDLFESISTATKYTERDASGMMFHVASAINYLHSLNIVHRDIKPENLLVHEHQDGTKSLKLGDFGLATLVTQPLFNVCGTLTYVAPEVLAEVGYGLKVDIWSAGVIAYILLCGIPPFTCEGSKPNQREDLMKKILIGKFEFFSPSWNSISDAAKGLIKHLLEVDVDKRFTAKQLLEYPWVAEDVDEERNLYSTVANRIVEMAKHDHCQQWPHINAKQSGVAVIAKTALDKGLQFFHDISNKHNNNNSGKNTQAPANLLD